MDQFYIRNVYNTTLENMSIMIRDNIINKINLDVQTIIENQMSVIISPFYDKAYIDENELNIPYNRLSKIYIHDILKTLIRKNYKEYVLSILNKSYAYDDKTDYLLKLYYTALLFSFITQINKVNDNNKIIYFQSLYNKYINFSIYEVYDGEYGFSENFISNCMKYGEQCAKDDIYATVYDEIISPIYLNGTMAVPEINNIDLTLENELISSNSSIISNE